MAIVGFGVFGERPGKLQVLGFVLAFVGYFLFTWDQWSHFIGSKAVYGKGNIWIVIAALTWVIYAIQLKTEKKKTPQQANLLIYWIAATAFAPMATFSEIPNWNGLEWAVMVFLGLNTLIAYGALAEAFKRLPASTVSVLITLNPVITLALMKIFTEMGSTWIEADRTTLTGYIGAAMVVTGAMLVAKRKRVQKRSIQKVGVSGGGPLKAS